MHGSACGCGTTEIPLIGWLQFSTRHHDHPPIPPSLTLSQRASTASPTIWSLHLPSLSAAIPSEVEALQSAHPGELEVILNNRVLGGIAITRGLFVFSIERPVVLPTQRSLWTVLKGPFAHKKKQENFERSSTSLHPWQRGLTRLISQ